jgi:hypothetical protein
MKIMPIEGVPQETRLAKKFVLDLGIAAVGM